MARHPFRTCVVPAAALITGVLVTTAAEAHHAMGGRLPATFTEGLLSGLGHPVIGLDHLAFIVGLAMLAAVAGLRLAVPVILALAMGAGLALHIAGTTVPAAELLAAVSVVLVGLSLLGPLASTNRRAAGLAFALAGALHGYAYAESIVGAEAGSLGGYVLGLVIVQGLIGAAAYITTLAAIRAGDPALVPRPVRAAGAAILAVGVAFTVMTSGLLA